MKRLFLYLFLATPAVVLHTGCLASEDNEARNIPATNIEAKGTWTPVSKGVWELVQPDGTIRRHAEGRAGLRWMLPELEVAGENLRHAYLLNPTPELWQQFQAHERSVEELRQRLEHKAGDALHRSVPSFPRALLARYIRSSSIVANAGPTHPGAYASAGATWNHSGRYVDTPAHVYTLARARVIRDGVTTEVIQTCFQSPQANDGCPAISASVSGTGSCYSYAEAYILMSASGGTVEQLIQSNYSCGTSPPPLPETASTGSAHGDETTHKRVSSQKNS